jgi:hypothetical protein
VLCGIRQIRLAKCGSVLIDSVHCTDSRLQVSNLPFYTPYCISRFRDRGKVVEVAIHAEVKYIHGI